MYQKGLKYKINRVNQKSLLSNLLFTLLLTQLKKLKSKLRAMKNLSFFDFSELLIWCFHFHLRTVKFLPIYK